MWEGLCRLCSNVVLFYIKYLSIHRFWFPAGGGVGRKCGSQSLVDTGTTGLCALGRGGMLGCSTARPAVNTDVAFPSH